MSDHDLDVRPLRKPHKHPAIFQAYAASWEYLAKDPRAWRIRITKLASTALTSTC